MTASKTGMEVATEIFRVSTGAYTRTAISLLAGKWWWLIVIPLLIAGFLSTVDLAYILAAMMWICLLMPLSLMLAFHNYLLLPVAGRLTHPHYVIIKSSGDLTIVVPPYEILKDDTTPAEEDVEKEPEMSEQFSIDIDRG
ncbi:MAG: hypothetical protein HDT01_03155, partial [Bacteroidales bacterium]|nr:hypothetical protein [Bacteroidales bacterium]